MDYIDITRDNLAAEHICCAFSDKKCQASYQAKKDWLSQEFEYGYTFKRLDERAKVFIEYGPAEHAWLPVVAPNYLVLGCFWVSGKYKRSGHGKALLGQAIADGKAQGKAGLVAVVGTKKFHFMSDTRWFIKQGFMESERTPEGFMLLYLPFDASAEKPQFSDSVHQPIAVQKGVVVYYSNRCPYSEYHVTESLVEACASRHLSLRVIKLTSLEQAQASPTPATIFSLYMDGRFVTTDISACMDSRFDKIVK